MTNKADRGQNLYYGRKMPDIWIFLQEIFITLRSTSIGYESRCAGMFPDEGEQASLLGYVSLLLNMSDTRLILHVKGTDSETKELSKEEVRTAVAEGRLTYSQLIWSATDQAWRQVRERNGIGDARIAEAGGQERHLPRRNHSFATDMESDRGRLETGAGFAGAVAG
jgi:hypothetical protein